MLRRIHGWPGLAAAVLVSVMAVTGAILSIDPALDRASAPDLASGQASVADLAGRAHGLHADIDKITRTASGQVIVSYFDAGRAGAVRVDPVTGVEMAPSAPSGFTRIVTNLHRSLLMNATGRILAGFGAVIMVVLVVSGAMMLAARLGGWAALMRPIRGSGSQRWHCELGRLAMLALLLSALTGCYLSLVDFELIADGTGSAAVQVEGSGGPRRPVGELTALRDVDVTDLRELSFPYAADLTDTYTLTTSAGVSRIDAATGDVIDYRPLAPARAAYELVYMLHTGQGLWPVGLLLGFAAAAVPAFAVTGGWLWWKRRRSRPRISGNVTARLAETIILVGSEGNATWGFARTLHEALTRAGHRVHTAPMNSLARHYERAKRMIVLTATYGDGAAPASANRFIARLDHCRTRVPVAVLGFGDRSFPRFCRFADDVAAALSSKGWPILLPLERIDRQDAQAFARWGEDLGSKLGVELELVHAVVKETTARLELVSRTDYGVAVQAPTAVLTFVPSRDEHARGWLRFLRMAQSPSWEAGDLVGILPSGDAAPRFYSIASASSEGVLQICVRKQPGGLCSTFLHELPIGGQIDAFIRFNPAFRPNRNRTPLILIGAGAGIGPLAGFIRNNTSGRPVHLYWGGRSPSSDFLYEDELVEALATRRLSSLHAAFSRVPEGGFVQDKLVANAAELVGLVRQGAQIMVCGGRDMASGVAGAIEAILQSSGLHVATLKERGLYVEDVY